MDHLCIAHSSIDTLIQQSQYSQDIALQLEQLTVVGVQINLKLLTDNECSPTTKCSTKLTQREVC